MLTVTNSSGYIGMGTTSPISPLNIKADGTPLTNGNNSQLIISGKTNPNYELMLGYDTTVGAGTIYAVNNGVANSPLLLNPIGGGNVGIGTTSPSVALHIVSSGSNEAIMTKNAAYTTSMGLMPWSGVAFLNVGIDYVNGAWVTSGGSPNGMMLALTPGGSTNLYNTSNSAASWNLAANQTLWTANGTLVGACSRTLKENFTPIDKEDIVKKISGLDITRWNYKSERDKGTTHIGPIAEDWIATFKTGDDEKIIPLIDEGGVALAGVQGLYRLHKRLEQELQEVAQGTEKVSSQNASIGEKFTALESRLESLDHENESLKATNRELREFLCKKDPEAGFCLN